MSAYLVEKDHIIFLLLAADSPEIRKGLNSFQWYHKGKWLELTRYTAASIAKTLADENIKSLRARYQEVLDHGFEFSESDFQRKIKIDPLQVIKSCDCYSYQANEHKGWKQSSAKMFVDTLRNRAIDALPGYDAAIWGSPNIK